MPLEEPARDAVEEVGVEILETEEDRRGCRDEALRPVEARADVVEADHRHVREREAEAELLRDRRLSLPDLTLERDVSLQRVEREADGPLRHRIRADRQARWRREEIGRA